jgi:glycerol-3-phosphate O-acyltransferase
MAKSSERLPHVFPDIEDWPIYQLSEDRKNFVAEIDAFTYQRIRDHYGEGLPNLLAKTIYLETTRTKEEPWKVDPPKERQWWKRLGRRLALKSLDRSREESLAAAETILQRVIHRYSEEIVGTFRIRWFLFARRFLTFFFGRLLNTASGRTISSLFGTKFRLGDKLVVTGQVEAVRELTKHGTVVIVPTHFSNLDSILIGYALDTFAGLPSFSYGAGLNLYNTGYTAFFMNRLGAYRVDRRKKNEIYLETLKAMSNLSIQRGVNSLFFPGGTRSRSGRLATRLKLGLLGTAVEAQRALYQRGQNQKVFIVPLILSYPFVLEAQFLIEQHLKREGRERYLKAQDNFHSFRSILKFAWGILSKGNDITLAFGQPMDILGNRVDPQGRSYDHRGRHISLREYFRAEDGNINTDLQRESEYTKLLAQRIVERFHRDNVVITSHLVSYAAYKMLEHDHQNLDLYGLLRLPPEEFVFNRVTLHEVVNQLRQVLMDWQQRGEIQLSEALSTSDTDSIIERGIKKLGNFHIDMPLRFDRRGRIVSDSFTVLYYYHNRLSTYDLERHINFKPDLVLMEPAEIAVDYEEMQVGGL